jgi:2-hydroxy-3-keto-5-methylthiopentenyl-1-phosphate phosphatase
MNELNSVFGHDKSLEIKPYVALSDQHRPLLLYAGDGVSDLPAASETHILFAKDGLGKFSPICLQCPITINLIYRLPVSADDT